MASNFATVTAELDKSLASLKKASDHVEKCKDELTKAGEAYATELNKARDLKQQLEGMLYEAIPESSPKPKIG